ncbi:hypothetical protein KVR01_011807 [Diaporthe batatas]|uniref:uncharacterized protein n=1 Tax=Diaporthe batatas TaxID=748121 RepID=UPI001D056C35|nr:uncharacterized protein KVR01_011807 [Diaporthe batatas]KAG8158685.1 hypothetical protein KVR01_011807 [Diaporthe batatas]
MPDHNPKTLRGLKALTFDVFGTVVDWRRPVEAALTAALKPQGHSLQRRRSATTEDEAAERADAEARAAALTPAHVAALAQEWRDSYKRFTHGFRPGLDAWKDVDAHHHDSLVALLRRHGLWGVFAAVPGGGEDAAAAAAGEVRELSLVWHRLTPWPDSAGGLRALGAGGGDGDGDGGAGLGLGLVTATLSNGNRALLEDLDAFGSLGFGRLLSAEDFGAYKPDPRVYLGAVERLGCEPGEVAMVAAHLNDLDAARKLGLRTIYVERDGEEDWQVGSERDPGVLAQSVWSGEIPTPSPRK